MNSWRLHWNSPHPTPQPQALGPELTPLPWRRNRKGDASCGQSSQEVCWEWDWRPWERRGSTGTSPRLGCWHAGSPQGKEEPCGWRGTLSLRAPSGGSRNLQVWVSCVQLFATPWTVAHQATLSLGLSRQESWSGLPFPSPGDLPDPGLELGTPAFRADSLPSEPPRLSKELPPSWGAGGKEWRGPKETWGEGPHCGV